MKKWLKILVGGCCAIILAACGMPKADETARVIILENDLPERNNLYTANVWERGSFAMDVCTNYPIYDSEWNEIAADELIPGMELEVGYNGWIQKVAVPYFEDIVYLKLTGETVDITELSKEHARRIEPFE